MTNEEKADASFSTEAFLKDRVIFMEEEFNEKTCNKLKKQLLYLMTHNEKEPVTIYISSYGGGIHEFLMLYGLLEKKRFPLTTIALGKAMSAGSYLLLLGDIRLAYPHSRIMFHELAYSNKYSKLHDQKYDYDESERLQKILTDLVKKVTKVKKVEEFLKKDSYVEIDEAKKLDILTGTI